MPGGSNYHIIDITTIEKKGKIKIKHKGKKRNSAASNPHKLHYILRIPRRENYNYIRLDREAAVLNYLETSTDIPVPIVVAFDLDGINGCPIERPYILQTRIPGIALDEAFLQMTFDEKKNFVRRIVDLYVKIDKIRFPCAGVLGSLSKGNGNGLEVGPFDLGPESDGYGHHRTYPQQKTRDMLLSQFEGWKIIADNQGHSHDQAELVSRYMDKFIDITLQMEKKGWLGDNKNILFHPDLSPRHIFVYRVRTGPKSKGNWEISGVIDWEAALSAPRVMANRAPSWLWGPGERDEKSDSNDPKDKEREFLKHQFEMEITVVLPNFLRYAYMPRYQLLRKLCRFAVWGLMWDEDVKRADGLLREWMEVVAGSSRK